MRSPHRETFLDLDKRDPLLQRLYNRRGDAVEFRLSSYKEFKSKNLSPELFDFAVRQQYDVILTRNIRQAVINRMVISVQIKHHQRSRCLEAA